MDPVMDTGATRDYWWTAAAAAIPGSVAIDSNLLAAAHPGLRVLDVGCGTGRVALALAMRGCDATGIDVNAAALAAADREAQHAGVALRCRFTAFDGVTLPFTGASFDVAVAVALLTVVHPAAARVALLAEIRRVLAPGGSLHIADFAPAPDDPHYAARYERGRAETGEEFCFDVHDDDGRVLYRAKHFTQAEIETLIAAAGFTVETISVSRFTTRSGRQLPGWHVWAI